MNKKTTAGMMIALITMWSGVAQAETVSVVQTTDMRGQTEYSVVTRDEYSALQKEIKEESAVFMAAVAEAKKEWESDKENKLPFQGSRIKLRSVRKIGSDYMDREKAEKKRSQLEDRASAKQVEEMDKASKKAKQKKPNDEEVAREETRTKAYEDAFAMISKIMGDKLGRPVPAFGLAMQELPKETAKAKEKEKKDSKKEREEKKAGH